MAPVNESAKSLGDRLLAINGGILQILSIWQIVTNVVKNVHDKGAQSVVRNVTNTANNLVQSGHLPVSFLEGLEEFLPDLVASHPDVINSVPDVVAPAAGSVAAAAAAPAAIDYDALAAAIARRERATSSLPSPPALVPWPAPPPAPRFDPLTGEPLTT